MSGCYHLYLYLEKNYSRMRNLKLFLHYEVEMSEFCILKFFRDFFFLIHLPQDQHSELSLARSASLICQQHSNVQAELTIAEGGRNKTGCVTASDFTPQRVQATNNNIISLSIKSNYGAWWTHTSKTVSYKGVSWLSLWLQLLDMLDSVTHEYLSRTSFWTERQAVKLGEMFAHFKNPEVIFQIHI